MIQTFPRDYLFTEPERGGDYPISQVALQIGNAVPPKLGEVIGESINQHLRNLYNE